MFWLYFMNFLISLLVWDFRKFPTSSMSSSRVVHDLVYGIRIVAETPTLFWTHFILVFTCSEKICHRLINNLLGTYISSFYSPTLLCLTSVQTSSTVNPWFTLMCNCINNLVKGKVYLCLTKLCLRVTRNFDLWIGVVHNLRRPIFRFSWPLPPYL